MSAWSYQAPNPITNFMVGVEFSGQIPSHILKSIAALHPQFKRDLPRKIEQPTFTFQFPGFPALPVPGRPTLPAQQQIGSVSFDRIQEDGSVSRALAVGPTNVTFMTASYGRWEEFQPLSDRLIQTISDIVMQEVNATGVLLTVINKFEWRDRTSKHDFGKLLNRNSRYIAPNMLSCTDHCHSFHGFLSQLDAPLTAQYVRNINISTADGPEAEKIVNIAFSHRTIFAEQMPIGSNLFSVNGNRGVFDDLCNTMHDSNNELFVDVIHPDISANIPGLSPNA
jgi:uncharacterized protein (TIGR04255 family)